MHSTTLSPPPDNVINTPLPGSITSSPQNPGRALPTSASYASTPASNRTGGNDSHSDSPPPRPSTPEKSLSVPPNFVVPKDTPVNPGLWSITATPGFDSTGTPLRRPGLGGRPVNQSDDDVWSNAADVGSRQDSSNDISRMDTPTRPVTGPGSPLADAMVGNGVYEDGSKEGSDIKKVHWTPSVTGGSSVTSGSPPDSPSGNFQPSLSVLPESFTPTAPPLPPDFQGQSDGYHQNTASISPLTMQDPRFSGMPHPNHTPLPAAKARTAQTPSTVPVIAEPEIELSHALIAKVQKHCRFAISSLDYEDAEQARRELRTALTLLGG